MNNAFSNYLKGADFVSDTLSVCGLTICRGSKLRTMLPVPGTEIEIPLTIINGAFDGPTLLVTAGIHGGEYPALPPPWSLAAALTRRKFTAA